MATIIGAGQIYDRIIGVGGITTSADGYAWSSQSQITEPFPPGMRAQGVASNLDGNAFVAISDNGYAAFSTDLSTWSNVRLLDADFSPLSVAWGNNGGARPVFAAAGTRKYNDDNVLPGEYEDNDQIAEILINETGQTDDWKQAFTHPRTSSFFYGIKFFSNVLIGGVYTDAWISVGQCNQEPEIWYTPQVEWTYGVSNVTVSNGGSSYSSASIGFSSPMGQDATAYATIGGGGDVESITVISPGSRYDTPPTVVITGDGVDAAATAAVAPIGPPDPYTWQRIPVPDAFAGRPVYDLCQYGNRLWFSGRGMIISTDDPIDGGWQAEVFTDSPARLPDYVSIAVNPAGQMVATSSFDILWSTDRVEWHRHFEPGYYFRSVAWFNDHWIVGAYSNLTQYTYFTSTDTSSWRARNNLVQMYGMWTY